MKRQTISMGMPVTVNVVDKNAKEEDISQVFSYLHYIDRIFSTYIKDSEISKINRREIRESDYTSEMKQILVMSEQTKKETNGYFDININGLLDPSGIVKGYAINEAANILLKKGYENIYVEIAGDIQVYGKDVCGQDWKIGIQNPFNLEEIIKVVNLTNKGIATSGNYRNGLHINNPRLNIKADELASVTVIAENIYEADRFATAIFAMGAKRAFDFIVTKKDFESYIIRKDREALFTQGFSKYIN